MHASTTASTSHCTWYYFTPHTPLVYVTFHNTYIHTYINTSHHINTSHTNIYFYSHVHSPVLSCLVPSLVGRVGAKDQQETQRTGGQGKGRQGQRQSRNVVAVDEGGVVDLVEIVVPDRQHVPQKDQGGNGGGGGNLAADVLVV